MADSAAANAFADLFAVEDETIEAAREASAQFGVPAVSPAVGVALALAAAAGPASSIIEIGTGLGVSGLWLLRGAPQAQLTSIDTDLEQHQAARALFLAAGYPARQLRLITGRAGTLLERMNEGAYDLVFVDAGYEEVADLTEAALRLVRPGGSVLVAGVLAGGKVPNPARRDRATLAYRDLLNRVRERDDVLSGISAVGDGLLHVVRNRDAPTRD